MYEHHKRAINKLVGRFENDPAFPAIIIGGSVAKRRCRPDSDIDVFMIATEEEYQRRMNDNTIHYYIADICDYPGGYIDGKVINSQFLMDVAGRGSEVARSAFICAFVAYSRIDGLDRLLKDIVEYPENEQTEKVRSFVAQLRAAMWYIGEAEKWQDAYLLLRNTTNLLLFGARMILAYNKKLYAFHKYLMDDFKNAEHKPENGVVLAEQLLSNPSKKSAEAFFDCIMTFTDWPEPPEGWQSRFIADTELNWRTGKTPIEDR